ncbi:Fructokinase [Beutenbergia cavernae DSM 12333]|uniref:Fructokinase n=1 Tax=Beutenbergia cavernae (strain ATCC BAA-8 / DSM 12333 / CCUG 43141 / JCM 11478 / NBRC 16432 / NCIMB 13614 / HKI 0122) TaxID=471853 RepID=C5C0V5_BEUC1|nr:carbohydrate kinase [Beutenbergia cavernae]ACQ79359.1 Fructokinase [Beutenbergia cavernae DSM 12333]
MSTVLVVGEALVDIVERAGEPARSHPGGSPANVALGLARLGRDVELVTWLGADENGELVRAHLAASGVRIAAGSIGAERTSTALATIGDDGAASYTFDLTVDYPEVEIADDVVAVHVGSIGATLAPGAQRVDGVVAAARDRATITYDPNLRPSIMGEADGVRPRIEALVAASDVVKFSDEDLAFLYPGSDPREVARDWAARGPGVVVVTLGAAGSFAVAADGGEAEAPAPTVTVADTVGAGDSFMGGLIDGLWSAGLLGAQHRPGLAALEPSALRVLLDAAARIAAITVSRPGADPPTRPELA